MRASHEISNEPIRSRKSQNGALELKTTIWVITKAPLSRQNSR